MTLVTYELAAAAEHPGARRDQIPVARLTMDDGKVNVMSLAMLEELLAVFDRAEADGAVVVLTGREQVFSAGYDLAMFSGGIEEIFATLTAGGDLVRRILSFPFPVLVACNGHAVAQGAFILLAADVRIGVDSGWKTGLNETDIGLTIPWYAVEVSRHRMHPTSFVRAANTGPFFTGGEVLTAGFVDELVSSDEFAPRIDAEAARLSALDMTAHAATKLRVGRDVLAAIDREHHAEFSG